MDDALRARVQRILEGSWMHAADALEAARSGSWSAFLRERNPSTFWPSPERRRCLKLAESLFAGPIERRVTVIPVWIGNNEDEEPGDSWFASHVEIDDHDQAPRVVGIGNPFEDADPRLDVVVQCRVRVWTVGHVVATRDYAPGIPLAFRGKQHSVLEAEVVEVVEAVEEPSTALSRPTLLVPSWCSWLEPRVAGLGPELVAAIRALSVTTDDEGNLVERPAVADGAPE